jgi:hypothetical protein
MKLDSSLKKVGKNKKNKKTLILTMGSPPEMGGKKNKKNLGINLGQVAGKGREKKKTSAVSAIENPARTIMSRTDGQGN